MCALPSRLKRNNIVGYTPLSAYFKFWKGGPAWYGTGLEIRQMDFIHARVQIPSFPYEEPH